MPSGGAVFPGRVGRSVHGWGVNGLAWLPEGKAIATSDITGLVLFSDGTTGKQRAKLAIPGGVSVLALVPDGKRLAVGKPDGKVVFVPVPELSKEK